MSRRSPTSRRPSMESLEARCNPSTFTPLNGNLQIADLSSVAIDPGPAYTFTLDPRSCGADAATGYGSNYKYIEDPSRSSAAVGDVTGDGFSDIVVGSLVGPRSADAPNGRLFVGTSVGVYDTALVIDPSNPNIVYSRPDFESIIDDLARDVAEATANRSSAPVKIFLCPSESRSFPGFTGGVYVATGDVNGGGIDDITSDTDGDELASGYVKVKKLTSGG